MVKKHRPKHYVIYARMHGIFNIMQNKCVHACMTMILLQALMYVYMLYMFKVVTESRQYSLHYLAW